jgi:ABC-type nitrate/sulfonate/bicarbonate transport system permease component
MPSIIPPFLIGVRVAVPLAIIITLLVEMITMLPGIGSLIVTAQRDFRSSEVYALLVLVGLVGFVLNNLFVVIEDLTLRRFPPQAHKRQ